MRYVDAGGCMKSLRIVPKQRFTVPNKQRETKGNNKHNELCFLFTLGSICFSRLSTYKV